MTHAVEIVAEIANAHQGDPGIALQLALAAHDAGADAVKFQVYSAEDLLVRSHPRFSHFQHQSFSRTTWLNLLAATKASGARVYCDVFGLDALEIATSAQVDGYKVHSSDLGNEPLLHALAEKGGRVLLAVGGSTVREIARAVSLVGRGAPTPLVLLHGFQSYPTAIEDARLSRLAWLQKLFGGRCEVGYMDHTAGDDPLAVMLPLLAVAMGATVLEKHITQSRAARGVDYYSSLEPEEFARFVEAVRLSERAIGGSVDAFAPAEAEYRRQVKKHWVAARSLSAGHVLSSHDLVMKRVADHAAAVVPFEDLLGRPLKRGCAEEEPITRADVPQTVWALVVARLRSTRLPRKALLDVGGIPALQHLLERLKQARSVDKIVLCTTELAEDDDLVQVASRCGVASHRGPVEDVLARMLGAVAGHAVDLALRVTGDDILVDPAYVDRAVEHHLMVNAEYSDLKKLPSGTEVEVFDVSLLRSLHHLASDANGTEYLTNYVVDHRDQFRTNSVPVDELHQRRWRLTLDTADDYQLIRTFLDEMQTLGKALDYRLDDIVAFFARHPDLSTLSAQPRASRRADVCTSLDWRRLTVPVSSA